MFQTPSKAYFQLGRPFGCKFLPSRFANAQGNKSLKHDALQIDWDLRPSNLVKNRRAQNAQRRSKRGQAFSAFSAFSGSFCSSTGVCAAASAAFFLSALPPQPMASLARAKSQPSVLAGGGRMEPAKDQLAGVKRSSVAHLIWVCVCVCVLFFLGGPPTFGVPSFFLFFATKKWPQETHLPFKRQHCAASGPNEWAACASNLV